MLATSRTSLHSARPGWCLAATTGGRHAIGHPNAPGNSPPSIPAPGSRPSGCPLGYRVPPTVPATPRRRLPRWPAPLFSNHVSQLRPHGKVQTNAARIFQGMGQVEANRADRRHPAHAHPHTGFQARHVQAVEGVALVDKGRNPPFFGDGILIFGTQRHHVAAADAVTAIVFGRQRLVLVATHALVTTGKKAQRRRHRFIAIGGTAAELRAAEKAVVVPQGGQTLDGRSAVKQVGVGTQAFLGDLGVEHQAIAIVRVDAVVAAQVGIIDPRHHQVTEARVIAQAVFFALIFERDDPRPAAGQFAVPFRAEGEQFTQGVGIGDFFILVAAGKPQFVGKRRVQRDVVPQADVLARRRQLGFPAITVTLWVDPVTRPVGFAARADVSRVTQAQAHGARLAGVQLHRHRDHIVGRGGGACVYAHSFEKDTRLQVLVEFGDKLGVVRVAAFERHHALQQVFIKRRVAGKADLAHAVAWAAVVNEFDIGDAGFGVNREFLAGKAPAEKAVARGLVLDQTLGVFVVAVVEHGAGFEVAAVGHAKSLEARGLAVNTKGHVAQMHRLAGVDGEYQAWILAAFYITDDLWLIVAQRLGSLAGLLFGAAAEPQQGFFITIAYPADIAFDVGFQRVVCRLDPHVQFALRQGAAACEQQNQAAGKSSWKLHRRGCYTSWGETLNPE